MGLKGALDKKKGQNSHLMAKGTFPAAVLANK